MCSRLSHKALNCAVSVETRRVFLKEFKDRRFLSQPQGSCLPNACLANSIQAFAQSFIFDEANTF